MHSNATASHQPLAPVPGEPAASPVATASITARLEPDSAALGLDAQRCARAIQIVGTFDADAPAGARGIQLTELYEALRRGRIAGRTEVVVPGPATTSGLATLLDLRSPGDAPGALAQRLDLALDRVALAMADVGAAPTPDSLAQEVGAHLEGFLARIYASRWFRAVYDKTITRGQYVYTLSNMHQFVRFTTRILGLCVANADDPALRVHYIRHLDEEVNHELIIERDLKALGEDVEFVTDRMAPNLATRQFMAAQESVIGFHRDPVLLMAAPLAAEGISGHLDQAFLDALHETAAGWGVPEPSRVTRFYASHMDFDGGEDGHWEGTVKMLAAHITDERKLASFLSVLATTTHAMERCYDSWIDDIRFG